MAPPSAYATFTKDPPYAPPNRALPSIPQVDVSAQSYQLPVNDSSVDDPITSGLHERNGGSSWQPTASWEYGESPEYHALSMLLNEAENSGSTGYSCPSGDSEPWLSPPEAAGVKRSSPEGGVIEQNERTFKTARIAPSADPELIHLTSDEYYDDLVVAPAHLDNGLVDGRYHCTCGRSYTRKSRLNDHLDLSNGSARYVCSMCPETFKRKDSRLRHERNAHLGEKWPCPICFRTFRADYIHHHLRFKGNGCREVISAALSLQGTPEVNPLADNVYQRYWMGGLSKEQSNMYPQSPPMSPELDEQAMDLDTLAAKFLRDRPRRAHPTCVYRQSREPCSICGEAFGPDEDDLIKHIQRHSVELATKPFRCQECCLDFAFAKDLARHQRSAALGHCGLNFDHDEECHGHHYKLEGRKMELRLEAWETCQIRAHQLTIIQLLLERLDYRRAARFSLNDCFSELSCLKTMDRFSKISIDSFSSVPAHIKMGDDSELEELARRFGLLGTGASNRASLGMPSQPRPESMVLEMGAGTTQGPIKRANGPADIGLPARSTYSQMVVKLRKPTEPPGPSQSRFRQAANNAAKFLKASNSHGRDLRHIGSTTH